MFEVSPVWYANFNSTSDIVINQGGTDSGKTYALVQLMFYYAKEHNSLVDGTEDLVITIVGSSVPNLKKGAYRIAKNIYNNSEELRSHVLSWNETDRMVYFKNGYVIEFASYVDEQSAKQGKRRYLFVNEAQGIDYPIFWQLAKRTRNKIFIDYNPSAPFWSHEKLIGTGPNSNDLSRTVQLIISDHRHNPFLTAEQHRQTENILDKDLWRVYARGMTGNLTGLIFPNWQMISNDKFPKGQPFTGGLDFGYTNDPTAGVKRVKIGNSIFYDELCYTPGLAPIEVKQIFTAEGFTASNIVYCDHDPEMVNSLRRAGLQAINAKKGNGSINAGIMHLKQFKVYYTERSHNLHTEKTKYMWKKDPATGKSINVPIDDFCHLIDACRYSEYSTIGGNQY